MRRLTPALTVTVALVVFVVATAVGVRLLLADASTAEAGPTCVDRTVAEGEKLTPNLVRVHARNASQRAGLANRVSVDLQRRGFLSGSVSNAPGGMKAKRVTILTNDRKDDQVRLVAKQFKDDVDYERPSASTTLEDGVTVVVGQDYSGLKKDAARSVKASAPTTLCLPTAAVVE